MGLRETVQTALQTDTALMALLTGGVHAATEISRQDTAAAFDANAELKPCALVRVPTDTPTGPYDTSTRTAIEIYFYQRAGYGTIDSALARVFTLLNRVKLTGTWDIRHGDDVTDQEDAALACAMHMSRYYATRLR